MPKSVILITEDIKEFSELMETKMNEEGDIDKPVNVQTEKKDAIDRRTFCRMRMKVGAETKFSMYTVSPVIILPPDNGKTINKKLLTTKSFQDVKKNQLKFLCKIKVEAVNRAFRKKPNTLFNEVEETKP